jgi:catechol 2,3-dioxygenase-like lactoylglutathione lyase family enzyme
MPPDTILRVARPTDRLEALRAMYVEGLGLEVLGSFEDHDGFDGVMLGHPAWPYHLEFTRHRGHPAGGTPSPEHLLVFYIAHEPEWRARCDRMKQAGFKPVPAYNPYWDAKGATFEDLDGYRVVLQNGSWPPR